jgi:hypothetical protein
MPSETAVNAAKLILSSASIASTYSGGPPGQAVNFLASQIDISIAVVEEAKGGKPDPRKLALLLVKKTLSVAGVPVSAAGPVSQCMVSIASLGMSAVLTAVSPAGTPAATVVAAVGLLADVYAMSSDCAAPAQAEAEAFAAPFYYGFINWLNSNGMGEIGGAIWDGN